MAIHLGIADEKNVNFEVFHTLFAGQTQLSGKTTTIRTLAPRAVREGFAVLIFDTKPNTREFEGYHEIPACYRTTTDALVLIGLLESIRKARLSPLYATLSRATEGVKSLTDISDNLVSMEEKSRSGFVKDACHTLADLVGRLNEEFANTEMSTTLLVKPSMINVMPLNELSVEAQQLILKTAFELALKWTTPLILVVDETFRFLPEQYSSACKRSIQDYVTQGAKTKKFVWLATQFLAPTDKDALKAMANKLLDRQDHNTEVAHEQALIPEDKKEWPRKTIMTLRQGEFIFVPMDGKTVKVYIDHPITERGGEPTSTFGRATSATSRRDIRDDLHSQGTKGVPGPQDHAGPPGPTVRGREDASTEEARGAYVETAASLSPLHNEAQESAPTPPPSEPKVETTKLATFILQVTRLESDSFPAKVVYILKTLGHAAYPKEIVSSAVEYGWNINASHFGRDITSSVRDGLIIKTERGTYRLPSEVKVQKVPA